MEYGIHLAVTTAVYIVLAVGLNLVIGVAGLLCLSYAAFMGVGAYSTALVMLYSPLSSIPALLLGTVAAAFSGLGAAGLLGRSDGEEFVLGTFAVQMVLFYTMLNLEAITRGPMGLPGIRAAADIGDFALVGACVAAAAITTGAAAQVINSQAGRELKLMRESIRGIVALGVNAYSMRLAVVTFGAALAGLSGGLSAIVLGYIDPSLFAAEESLLLIAMVIVGGLGTIRGSITGAAIIVLVPEAIRLVGSSELALGNIRAMAYSTALIWTLFARPCGIFGDFSFSHVEDT